MVRPKLSITTGIASTSGSMEVNGYNVRVSSCPLYQEPHALPTTHASSPRRPRASVGTKRELGGPTGCSADVTLAGGGYEKDPSTRGEEG